MWQYENNRDEKKGEKAVSQLILVPKLNQTGITHTPKETFRARPYSVAWMRGFWPAGEQRT